MTGHNGSAEEKRAELARLIAVLSDEEVQRLTKSSRRQRNMIIALVASFCLELLLTLFLALGAVQLGDTQDRLTRVQEVTSGQVLCPLYRQFINADTPRAREAAVAAGQDIRVRDETFRTIRAGYTALGCTPALG